MNEEKRKQKLLPTSIHCLWESFCSFHETCLFSSSFHCLSLPLPSIFRLPLYFCVHPSFCSSCSFQAFLVFFFAVFGADIRVPWDTFSFSWRHSLLSLVLWFMIHESLVITLGNSCFISELSFLSPFLTTFLTFLIITLSVLMMICPHEAATAANIVENPQFCQIALTLLSVVIIACTLPFSLFFCIKVGVFIKQSQFSSSLFPVKLHNWFHFVISGCPRIRKSSYLQTGSSRVWRSSRSWNILHHSVYRYLFKGRSENSILWCSSSRSELFSLVIMSWPSILISVFFFYIYYYCLIQILSRDSVTVAVDAVVYFRISNAIASVSNVEDYARSTRLLAATTLRNVLGTKNLSEILSERESISHMIQSALDDATDTWGVKVERVEM